MVSSTVCYLKYKHQNTAANVPWYVPCQRNTCTTIYQYFGTYLFGIDFLQEKSDFETNFMGIGLIHPHSFPKYEHLYMGNMIFKMETPSNHYKLVS